MRQTMWMASLVMLVLCASCNGTSEQKHLASSKGLPSELLLVVDKDVWQSDLADTLQQLTQGDVPGLPQSESFFRVTRIFTQHYAPIYSTMHTQLFVRLTPGLAKPRMGINTDVVARPQLQVTVEAANLDDLRGFLSRQGDMLRHMLLDAQLNNMAASLRRRYSKKVAADLQSLSPYTVCVPEEIRATKRGKDFLWAGTNANDKDINFVYYSFPYEGGEVFYEQYFADKRDSVMKANIPGSTPEQWMATTRVEGTPLVHCQVRDINERTCMEVHGLWEMHNGGIGGPFVSLMYVDTADARVVVAEGFVYSPRTDKRDLVRRMEASLRTLRRVK